MRVAALRVTATLLAVAAPSFMSYAEAPVAETPGVKGWKTVIATPDAPEAIGPYSQAIRAGNLVFLGGQIALDPVTKELNANASIEEQTALVLNHIKAILAADGLTLDHVISTTVFMTDLDEFDRMNTVYATYFMNQPPARATVGVARLALNAKVEISAIAIRP